jgi:serralysin
MMRSLGVILFSAAFSLAVQAGSGDLDGLFGGGGKIVRDSLPATGLALQPDRKMVTVGLGTLGFELLRHNADGTLDTGFGNGGRVNTSFGAVDSGATAIAIQTDGKIVVTGYVCPCDDFGPALIAIARYNPDGSLDTSFDVDGKVTTSLGNRSTAYTLLIQPDKKILVGGWTWIFGSASGKDHFALARYNTDGSLDSTFSGDGKQTLSLCGVCNDEIISLALQPDGMIVAVGGSFDGTSNTRFQMMRLYQDGSPDLTFGQNGFVQTTFGTGQFATAVFVQPDGKIVAAGSTFSNSWSIAVARYQPDGRLDTTFSADGMVTTAVASQYSFANSMTLQPDGKILVSGYASDSSGGDMLLVRYGTEGSLDPSFSGDGIGRYDLGSDDNVARNGLALDHFGRAILAGESNGLLAIARVNLSDSVSSVSVAGSVTTSDGRPLRGASVVVEDALGAKRIVITGSLGFFVLEGLASGENYKLSVVSKKYRFDAVKLFLGGNLAGLDLKGQE